MIRIKDVIKNSPADKAGIKSGDFLISVNMNEIGDVLDYMYYCADNILKVKLSDREVIIKKDEYSNLGLEFESFLMSEQRSCKNNCIFCFIEQNPPNMRETVYFKDDDSRLSFLQGNYISLTNLTEREVERIIKMRLSVNVSVHTTDETLRCKMLGNKKAGEALGHLYKMARAGIELNCQIVICPGVNDGVQLDKTLTDLTALGESIKSIACVPVGITKFRKNLKPLDKEAALNALEIIEKYKSKNVFASDELYITAGRNLPNYTEYEGDFPQYENGVGMIALLEHEFADACHGQAGNARKEKSIATGVSAAPFLERLLKNLNVKIFPIENNFFGKSVTVAGLVTGGDLIEQLLPFKNELGEELLIPETMLRKNDDVFLDNITVGEVEAALGVKVKAVEVDGYKLYEALI